MTGVSPRRSGGVSVEVRCQKLEARSQKCGRGKDQPRMTGVSPRRSGGASVEVRCQKPEAGSQKYGDGRDQPQTTRSVALSESDESKGLSAYQQVTQVAQMLGVRNLLVSSSLCGGYRLDVPSPARKTPSKSPRKSSGNSLCKSRGKSACESRCESAGKPDWQSPRGSVRK
jgi:hypothetical protein